MDNTIVTINSPQTTTALSRTGWDLPANMTEADWKRAGQLLMEVNQARQWWLGDWWNACKWGDDRRKEICKQIGVEYPTAKNAGWVSRKFEMSRRRDNLTFTHHHEAASISDPAIQDQFLDWCLSGEKRKSVRDLREKVQEYLEKKDWEDFDAEVFLGAGRVQEYEQKLAEANKRIQELQDECQSMFLRGTKKYDLNNLIPELSALHTSGDILEHRAKILSTLPEEHQKIYYAEIKTKQYFADKLHKANEAEKEARAMSEEARAKLQELAARPEPKPKIVEKVVEVEKLPEDFEKRQKEVEKKDRQATKILKTVGELQKERDELEKEADAIHKERMELKRKLKAMESKQDVSPSSIDTARALKLGRMLKELDWVFPDIRSEAKLAGGGMEETKKMITSLIQKWASILEEIDGYAIIDV